MQYNKIDLKERGIPLLSVATLEKDLNSKLKKNVFRIQCRSGNQCDRFAEAYRFIDCGIHQKRSNIGENKLVEPNDSDSLNPELDNRLEDLFGNDETTSPEDQAKESAAYYPLSELKNLILSIDWEITDEILEKLLQQIKDLNMTYEHDKIVLTFLQILNTLGGYIKKNRANAHPKTFKTLNSVFSSLDKVVLTRDMEEAEKKKILSAEMNRYKQLKIQIAQSKKEKQKSSLKKQKAEGFSPEAFSSKANTSKEEFSGTDQRPDPSALILTEAVEEIKQYIHSEIKALKEEIKSLFAK